MPRHQQVNGNLLESVRGEPREGRRLQQRQSEPLSSRETLETAARVSNESIRHGYKFAELASKELRQSKATFP